MRRGGGNGMGGDWWGEGGGEGQGPDGLLRGAGAIVSPQRPTTRVRPLPLQQSTDRRGSLRSLLSPPPTAERHVVRRAGSGVSPAAFAPGLDRHVLEPRKVSDVGRDRGQVVHECNSSNLTVNIRRRSPETLEPCALAAVRVRCRLLIRKNWKRCQDHVLKVGLKRYAPCNTTGPMITSVQILARRALQLSMPVRALQ